MRIGIDARFFGSIGKGLGRYTQKLIENIEALDDQNQYFVFLRKENWEEYQPRNKNFQKVLADIPWYGLREQFQFPKIIKKHKLDLMHFPHFNVPVFYKGKFVVTIHDLILLHHSTKRASTLSPFFYFFKKTAYNFVIRRAVRKSEKIIAVSKHTKGDIEKYFGTPSEKIIVTYEAIDASQKALSEPGEKILKKYGIMKPYLLYVGNAYPHKNLERLVLVFREIRKKHPHLHLVFVGKEDYFYRRLKKFVSDNFAKNVIFADYVPDDHLGIVYRDALLYVFPSLYEGFGLPPLEAMARNIPVASSSASCLPEILGEAAAYFDPKAMSEMAETIEKAIVDGELRRELMEKGQEQIKKYSWKKMARETLNIYKNIK
jgi:glycosyltransferase involved in cell wall biosynthesis